jgi:adiponectin receptor
MTGAAVVGPWLQSNKWTWLRLVLFVSTGFSALAPIIHGATIFPYGQLDKQTGLRYYYLEGVLMLAGVALFVVSSERNDTSEPFCC